LYQRKPLRRQFVRRSAIDAAQRGERYIVCVGRSEPSVPARIFSMRLRAASASLD
jgi:hypothetical protein